MYSLSNSATHHIFFPPRLQLVALQQDPDCLSSHVRDQFAFDRLFDDQADSPASPPFRRFTADHGDDPLFLRIIENLLRSRSGSVVEGAIQAVTVIAMSDLAYRLWSQGECLPDLRRGDPASQLLQRQRAQDDAYLLNTTSQ